MDRITARDEVRKNWRSIILNYGIQQAKKQVNGKPTYICPFCNHGKSGDGMKDNPASRDGNGIKCFNCGFAGDILDLIQQVKGVHYDTALNMAAADLGIDIDDNWQTSNPAEDLQIAGGWKGFKSPQKDAEGPAAAADDKTPANDPEGAVNSAQNATEATEAEPEANYQQYFRECMGRLFDPAAVSYLQARGISAGTATKCYLGYDPEWISPTVKKRMQQEGKNWLPAATARIIMPVSNNHYVARAISPDIEKQYAKMNETGGGKAGIFNARILSDPSLLAVFVTEGIFDALSIIEVGYPAIALNSTSNADLLIKQLEQSPIEAALILCLDNDNAGRKATEKITEAAGRLHIDCSEANICGGHKDPNEALVADRSAFENEVSAAQAEAIKLPGFVTYTDAVDELLEADDSYIELPSFPQFSKAAKIKKHSSVVLAADTGAGKSSLAINFLNDLNDRYPCIYFNLEMDNLTVLRRLIAVHSGMELDRIEGYKNDKTTAESVNSYLKTITSRKPLQIVQGAYMLEDLEQIIAKSTKGRKDTTVVFIDHSLLIDLKAFTAGRYERFTRISESLRKIALKYNVILFVLLQQSRSGKADDEERPKNSSLKESGSWENDATHICFLWYDPQIKRKKLLITKNRGGGTGEFSLDYWSKTQAYKEESKQQAGSSSTGNEQTTTTKGTRRQRQQEKLLHAYDLAAIETQGRPTLRAMAEAADVTTATIKGWIKEYGGCIVDGKRIEPAGIDTEVEYTGLVMLTPADETPYDGTQQDNTEKINRI